MLTPAIKTQLINQLNASITENGNREITGEVMNEFLASVLEAVYAGSDFTKLIPEVDLIIKNGRVKNVWI